MDFHVKLSLDFNKSSISYATGGGGGTALTYVNMNRNLTLYNRSFKDKKNYQKNNIFRRFAFCNTFESLYIS